MDAIIVRRGPTGTLTVREPVDMYRELDRFVNDVWDNWTPEDYEDGSSIPTDIYEMGDSLVIRSELPGFRKEDIDLSLEGDELTIKATRKDERSESTKSYSCELCYGEYSRSIVLPIPINSEKIEATFENGMLEVKLPKTEESKPKHIEVKVK
jgi:HSP20 family protein